MRTFDASAKLRFVYRRARLVEGLREGLGSVGRTVVSAFVFTGRSRRLDVAYYWLASMLLNAAFHFVAASLGEWDSRLVGGLAVEGLLALPFFALFARRLHDQGRSGWWALLLPPLAAANIYETLRVNFHAYDPQWPEPGYWHLALIVFVLLFMAMLIVPGTIGSNSYGPDARAEKGSAVAV